MAENALSKADVVWVRATKSRIANMLSRHRDAHIQSEHLKPKAASSGSTWVIVKIKITKPETMSNMYRILDQLGKSIDKNSEELEIQFRVHMNEEPIAVVSYGGAGHVEATIVNRSFRGRGIAHAFGQMCSIVGGGSILEYPAPKTVNAAFMEDRINLWRDFSKAAKTVQAKVASKAGGPDGE